MSNTDNLTSAEADVRLNWLGPILRGSALGTKMLTAEQRQINEQKFLRAVENARAMLRAGDRIRFTKCPGTKRWATFVGWSGNWIVSKSGIDDIAALCIDRVNDQPVNFESGKR